MSDSLGGIRKELAEALLTETLKALLARIRSGEATAADLNVARQTCKDMGIQMVPTADNPLGHLKGALTDSLPFAGDSATH